MELKRFNAAGVAALHDYIEQLRRDPSLPPPFALLDDAATSEPLDAPIMAEPASFESRMDFACWLHAAAISSNTIVPDQDAKFWAWLTLLLFDQVCPSKNGARSVGADARYFPDRDFRRRYRHLLANAYGIHHMHRDDPSRVQFLLAGSLHVFGELTEQFASRQELISCPGTMGLANRLFFDERSGRVRSSAGGAAARRLGKLLNQYLRTWDIAIMSPTDSVRLLPAEFDRFKPAELHHRDASPRRRATFSERADARQPTHS